MQNKLGIAQFKGQKPKQTINLGGVEWRLRRDAADPSSPFPHQLVNWINAGCDPIGDGTIFACWIHGLVPPKQDTQERPVQVMYVGFHTRQVYVTPQMLTPADADSMHVYITDGGDFAKSFVGEFLGLGNQLPVQVKEAVSVETTPDLDMAILTAAVQKTAPVKAEPITKEVGVTK